MLSGYGVSCRSAQMPDRQALGRGRSRVDGPPALVAIPEPKRIGPVLVALEQEDRAGHLREDHYQPVGVGGGVANDAGPQAAVDAGAGDLLELGEVGRGEADRAESDDGHGCLLLTGGRPDEQDLGFMMAGSDQHSRSRAISSWRSRRK